MIVKNESPVIKRCLASVKHRIDYWVIVDTGSTDGTQALIKEYMQDVPGELHERPWVDFAHNRNEALKLAKKKADYLLFIDADQILELPEGATWPELNRDCYYVNVHSDFRYSAQYILLIKSRLKMAWKGVLHEALISTAKTFSVFKDIQISAYSDGNRTRDPDKYIKDAQILEKALAKDPENARYTIFLGLTYNMTKNYEAALKCFEKRATMGGWDEEVFYSLVEIAHLQRRLNADPEVFISSYEKAYRYRPSRAEPLFWMADYYISVQNFEKGYALAKEALPIPIPLKDQIYVEYSVYQHELLLQFIRCSYQTGRYKETLDALIKLLANPKLPEKIRFQAEDILEHVKQKANFNCENNLS